MKIHVEVPECAGHGECYLVSPELFPLDDDGFSAVNEDFVVPEGSEDIARRGVESCPQQAITEIA